jgi:hypothetical protein
MSNRKLRIGVRKSTRGEAGYALGYGLRIGYWPCLLAPYVQIAFHHWRVEIWHGLPSYKAPDLTEYLSIETKSVNVAHHVQD